MLKMLYKRKVLLLFLLGMLVFICTQSRWWGQWVYPIPFRNEIGKWATIYNVDPLLIAAIIRVETNFQPGRKSPKGALGLMQIMPKTATWVMKQLRLQKYWTMDELTNEIGPNIHVGTWYLNCLYAQFRGNWIAVIAAYNAGLGNVKRWIRTQVWDGHYETVKRQIPYRETKQYVQRVIHYYNKYKDIYSDTVRK